ncbi:polyphenol oxidase family protein [Helicobacter mesocricetorum]|uniref:polyphenol oxidase family protein n=1 Tax=Helicobacter mesocricetorum TaxID=87012 RepID=UPI001F2528E2|nr:polyphenol oxidase family protein [Helicobacter mesocricetorum]
MNFWFSPPHINIAFHAGNNTQKEVLENRQNSLKMDYTLENLAYLNQIHSSKIIKAKSGGFLGDGDGILIDKKGIVGMIMVADCNPILLFDCQKQVLVLIHGGRVGIEKGIVLEGLRMLKEKYQSSIENISVYVGASIRSCCYEVGEEVFRDESLLKGKIVKGDKIYLDLLEVLKEQLQEKGVQDKNITINPHCTCCSLEYFSYRRDKHCGRFGLFATL